VGSGALLDIACLNRNAPALSPLLPLQLTRDNVGACVAALRDGGCAESYERTEAWPAVLGPAQ
jgi:hypothetical protein